MKKERKKTIGESTELEAELDRMFERMQKEEEERDKLEEELYNGAPEEEWTI